MYGTNINICNLHYYSIQLHAKMLKLLDSVLEHSSGTPLHLLLVTDRQQNNRVHHLTIIIIIIITIIMIIMSII